MGDKLYSHTDASFVDETLYQTNWIVWAHELMSS